MKITFDVKNQIITRTDRNQVISNSGDYLEAEISFSADWTGLEKTMTFKNGDELYTIVLANDKILQENHLNLGVGTWKASIIGIAGDQKIVTNECNVSVNSSGWIGSESIPPESVWNQLLVIIQSLHTEAASTAVVRSAVQKYIEDNYDSLVKEYIIIGNVREIIEELVQDGTISDLIAPFVTQELPGVVTTQLPGVVTSQLPAVVTSQLPSVVSSQLPAVAASAAAAEVGTWLTAHVDPDTGYVIDNTLTVSLAAADAKTVGDKVTAIKSALKEWNRLNGVSIKDGTDLMPIAIDKGLGGYYYSNGSVIYLDPAGTGANYAWAKIPVDALASYTAKTNVRWYVCLDENDDPTSYSSGSTNLIIQTDADAVSILITWLKADAQSFAKGLVEASSTEYVLPQDVVISQKINSYMIEGFVDGNLFHNAVKIASDKYCKITDGHIDYTDSATYVTYIIEVDGNSKYNFSFARFAVLLGADAYNVSYSTALPSVYEVDLTDYPNTHYIAFSFSTHDYPEETYVVSKGNVLKAVNTLPSWMITDGSNKNSFDAIEAPTLTDGQSLIYTDNLSELRKGERLVIEAEITTFSSIEIGRNPSSSISSTNKRNIITIDETNISYKSKPSSNAMQTAHGLNIVGNIQVILEQTNDSKLIITLISDGISFAYTIPSNVYQKFNHDAYYLLSIGSSLTDVKVQWTCVDFRKKIWMFGDSYFSYDARRWTYYLAEYGYDKNCLLNAYPGESGADARKSVQALLKFGTPKFAVWCLGMNDGSDNGAPSNTWVTARNQFLDYCAQNNVTPIFGTIPTVPSINHEYKNAWIRSSGLRYIDFAKAVGAQADGTWFSGMLSSDNVHPTEQGAKALFARALLDLPELMLDN